LQKVNYQSHGPNAHDLLKPGASPRSGQDYFQYWYPDVEGREPEHTKHIPWDYQDWKARAFRKRYVALPISIQVEAFVQRCRSEHAQDQGEEHDVYLICGAVEEVETKQNGRRT